MLNVFFTISMSAAVLLFMSVMIMLFDDPGHLRKKVAPVILVLMLIFAGFTGYLGRAIHMARKAQQETAR